VGENNDNSETTAAHQRAASCGVLMRVSILLDSFLMKDGLIQLPEETKGIDQGHRWTD
jgi:hypothetical protein